MADPLTLLAGIATLGKTVAEIAASNDAAQRNTLLIEFQKALIQNQALIASEQIKNATLVSRAQELEQEISRLKDWAGEREKYELKEIAAGVFARVEKGFVGKLQSAPKFCANCFEENTKSPLQLQHVPVGRQLSLSCGPCKSTIVFRYFVDQA